MSLADMPFADLLRLSVMTVATVAPDGQPHAAAVYFACDEGLHFYFFSEPGSQHSLDAASDGRAAVAIYPECQGWQDIRGLQLRGAIQRVDPGAAWERAWECYLAKFPFVSDFREVLASNQLYVFIPEWMRLVDNRRGFGFKQEWIREPVEGNRELDSGWLLTTQGSTPSQGSHG